MMTDKLIPIGSYVLATKYADGDPGDHFAIGYYREKYIHGIQTRYVVVDIKGLPFRANGFRRIARIGASRGNWIIAHFALIERMKDRFSVWHWHRASWDELRSRD